jgi:hypothetical protein
MGSSSFLVVKREEGTAERCYVVHSLEPRFSIEVDPSYNPLGTTGAGFVKSIRLNNSWTGDYNRCLSLVKQAEEFFRQTFLDRGQRL